jgi:hypothetical protein
VRLTSRSAIENEIKNFYSNLFKSEKTSTPATLTPTTLLPTIPPFLKCEIKSSISTFSNGKAAGKDKISAEFLKSCDDEVLNLIADCFNVFLSTKDIPAEWRKSKTVLIHKKGDKEKLENYRPITILPVLYKLFTKCILRRIRSQLEEEQPIEQAGFRKAFSTLDHISTLQRILEAAREHAMPATLIFIDYQKAFDSVEPEAVWRSLHLQGIETGYIDLLQKCYQDCSTTFTPFYNEVQVPITRGVRQGDPISPNLFAACLEGMFKNMDWSQYGIPINGQKLNHLRFADDIVLISHNSTEANIMLNQLIHESRKVGLKINESKTKCLRNEYADTLPIRANGTLLDDTDEYIYLGRLLNPKNELLPEIYRRRRAAWAALNKLLTTTNAMNCPKSKAELFDTIVLPALCYGSESWTFTKALAERVRITHAALERKLVGITLTEQRERDLHREDIRKMSKLRDPLIHIERRKLGWAGHIARRNDNRWTTATLEWYPRDWKRPRGRPPMRWTDSLRKEHNTWDNNGKLEQHWSTRAKNREIWKTVIRATGEERID